LFHFIAFRIMYLIDPADKKFTMPPIGTLYSAGIWTVKPGNEAAFIKTWESLAQWTTSTMKGIEPAVLVQDADNPGKFISFGSWKDIATLTQWRSTPEFKKAFATFRVLCSEIQPLTLKCVASAG
jgi:heme-degrading monooxygenase HmoA